MSANDDDILFKDEEPIAAQASQILADAPWKILIVDDEADVHSVTSYMLAGQTFQNRSFSFLHAYNGEEARKILAAENQESIGRTTGIGEPTLAVNWQPDTAMCQ